MKKIIKLTESDLHKIVTRVLNEQLANVVDSPQEIMNFQKELVKLGYNLGKSGPQKNGVDGKIGRLTRGAIASFQRASKLPVTGKLDQMTQNKIDYADSVNYKASTAEWNQKLIQLVQRQKQKQSSEWGTEKQWDDYNKKRLSGGKTNVDKNNSKVNYRYSPRIDAEIKYIKQRQGWWDKLTGGKPFFIYDPKFNLIYLFNGDFSLVKSSAVVDGKDAQGTTTFTPAEWCKKSGLEDKPYNCTDPKTKQKKEPFYSVLNNEKTKFLPKGIYSISSLSRHEGYVGKGKNVYHLENSKGESISQAIHGVPPMPGRMKASKELADLLMADKNNGKVPQEYLNAVDTVIASANLSYGCVGVPASFLEDPKVISIVEEGVPVYVMGESEKGFLVQNSGNYFDTLGGKDGTCVNPETVAQSMGSSISGPSKPNYNNIA
jgi:peptidoglycan hydrolase-like protein with peptidoglycan-binding domain